MSLTSYRAAPPRVTKTGGLPPGEFCVPVRLGRIGWRAAPPRVRGVFPGGETQKGPVWGPSLRAFGPETVNGFYRAPPAIMPGDDLLFQRLSVSTIGAVRFHGRVRDGIGWGTDAMVTKQYGRRNTGFLIEALFQKSSVLAGIVRTDAGTCCLAGLTLMVGLSSMNRVIRTG